MPDRDAPGEAVWLADMAWPAAARRLDQGAVVLIPVGAGAKAHGPHLPLGTDRIVVEALTERVARRVRALAAPTVLHGYYPAFVEYPASLHLSAGTFQDVLIQVMRRLIESGCARLAILNNGVSTEGPVMVAAHAIYAEAGVRPAVAHLSGFGRSADRLLAAPGGGHADERETSVMLALRPDLVDMSAAAAAPDDPAPARPGGRLARPVRLAVGRPAGAGEGSADGATGDPRAASAEKGREILQAMEDDLVAELDRVFGGAPDR